MQKIFGTVLLVALGFSVSACHHHHRVHVVHPHPVVVAKPHVVVAPRPVRRVVVVR